MNQKCAKINRGKPSFLGGGCNESLSVLYYLPISHQKKRPPHGERFPILAKAPAKSHRIRLCHIALPTSYLRFFARITSQIIIAAIAKITIANTQIGHFITILLTCAVTPSNSTVYTTLNIPIDGVCAHAVSL